MSDPSSQLVSLLTSNGLGHLWDEVQQAIGSPILCVEDCTRGCDNCVYALTLKEKKVILRIPKIKEDVPASHSTVVQAAITNKLHSIGVSVPEVLHWTPSFMIESFIDGSDWGSSELQLTSEQDRAIGFAVGQQLKNFHSVETTGFGYSSTVPFVADERFPVWHDLVNTEYIQEIDVLHKKGIFSDIEKQELLALYTRCEAYIKAMRTSRLLHSDLSRNNIRIKDGSFAALIDFDCRFGDPLYDIGISFECVKDDVGVFNSILAGYGLALTDTQKQAIKLYGIQQNLWLLHTDDENERESLKSQMFQLLKLDF